MVLTNFVLSRFDSERQLLVGILRGLALLSHFAIYKQKRVQSTSTENTTKRKTVRLSVCFREPFEKNGGPHQPLTHATYFVRRLLIMID